MRRLDSGSFVVLAHGVAEAPPASGLIEYLLARGAGRVTTLFYPLSPEAGRQREVTLFEGGRLVHRRAWSLPGYPPWSYPLDVLWPPVIRPGDVWFAFNNLLASRGLLERRLGRTRKVVYWAVDFVPDRFGTGRVGGLMTRLYDGLDARCCRQADLRIDLSTSALEGREQRHGLAAGEGAPSLVTPIGVWIDRVPTTDAEAWRRKRLVFMGHLVERMGCETMIAAVAALLERGFDVTADIVGRGPSEEQLRASVARRGLGERLRFHGFVPDHRDLERILAQGSIAVAPYSTGVASFTRYADPGKLKSYLAAGLPIVLTDVPPNARELADLAGAEVVEDNPRSFADAIQRVLETPPEWSRRRALALAYAKQFDWNALIPPVLHAVGFES